MAGLTLQSVVKQYGTHPILHGIDLAVKNGEFVVLVGPSGCGKSTLLRIIAGLETTTNGQILIGDEDVTKLPPGDRGIAMVFQSYALYPHMTVRKNLSFGLENLSLSKAEIDGKVAEAARMLAIEPLLERRPKQLSGGQRQRVAIGRAIVRDPKIFLFDEPLSNLDAALRVQTRGEISRLHKRLGATMIYVTHDQIEAMTMADRIAVLNGGNLEQFGAPLELFEFPANKFVAGFIGSPQMNFYSGKITHIATEKVSVTVEGFGELSVPVDASTATLGEAIVLGIRPNHFHLLQQPSDKHLAVKFRASYAESVGTETYVYGKVEGNETATVVHLPDHVPVSENDTITFGVEPSRLHLFHEASGLSFAKRRPDGSLIAQTDK
ncbi:sn-glycerol-3-phosphate ABC transporter ATP-binding protein UgpC [Agrobacterium tumefaciens]|uniref:ABC transporter ATP-binding protein n=1 Tax=Agrobacterium tumefaciens TaxID=358 RepID=UPI00287E60C6|nr:sn-glycerol-3-phosphate ABC transporter ATP-binding protein UgpC [Agrobacterium tumefaciens]MDS7595737.1 sn-glycerol-3-phosphate ABC transporter ATP-binding protein UgpC [Agrobacterium tumefaciens]